MNLNKSIAFQARILIVAAIAITACTNKTIQRPAEKDSTFKINVYPTDSNVPVDTDNHNVGNISTVTLDSPVGPPKHLDTTKLIEPKKR